MTKACSEWDCWDATPVPPGGDWAENGTRVYRLSPTRLNEISNLSVMLAGLTVNSTGQHRPMSFSPTGTGEEFQSRRETM